MSDDIQSTKPLCTAPRVDNLDKPAPEAEAGTTIPRVRFRVLQ
jgi:hypothetical protein